MKKPRRHTPVIAESESVMNVPPPAPLVIKLSAQKKAPEKVAAGLGKISSCLKDFLIILSSRATNLLIWDAGTEVVGEQEDYYDPLFTYREGDEASYFISDEPEGRVVDVGLRCWRGQRKPNGFEFKRIVRGTYGECYS